MDLHKKPFDDATIAKLEIFENYAEQWLPTFVMKKGDNTLAIIDFFAGTGYDENGTAGSPIRILKVIRKFIRHIFQKNITLKVYFNEFKKKKCQKLNIACSDFFKEFPAVKRAIQIEILNLDFDNCFQKLYPVIQSYPSLVFLDQNGIKFLSMAYLLRLEKTKKTDFLYFVSSSYFFRFGDTREFQKHFAFDLDEAKKYPYRFIHNILLEQLRRQLPPNSGLKLYPFSIKKGGNIHGLIFGSKSPRALEKFLNVVWKQNQLNGNANFDIDEDKRKAQLSIFEPKRLTKIEAFQEKLKNLIKTKIQISNKEIYLFTLEEGHPPSHSRLYLLKLKKAKKIHFEGKSPKIIFGSLRKNGDLVSIKWIKQ